jgi:hypothetical protein
MFIKTSVSNGTANKRAAANRRHAGQSGGSGESQRAHCRLSELPGPIAELGQGIITLMRLSTFQQFGSQFLVFFLALGLCGCMTVGTAMIPGQTFADFTLKRDTYRQLGVLERGCAGTKNGQGVNRYADPDIVDTTVVEYPVTPGGSWKEHWKVRRTGGVTAVYTVTYRPSPQGGTDISVRFPPQVLP